MAKNDFQVAEFFNLKEFACPCCGVTAMDHIFIKKLNNLREARGRVIVSLGGGYRCDAYQRAIHIARSQVLQRALVEPIIASHTMGRGSDVTIYGLETGDLIPLTSADIPFLKDLGFTGVGISRSGWAHVDDAHPEFQTWEYNY